MEDINEKEANNTRQEYSVNYVDLPPYLALVGIIGVVTNAALLYILTKIDLKKTTNGVILNMTLSNLLFVLVFIPLDIVMIGSEYYPFSDNVCKATGFLGSLCFFVWPFTLIALNFTVLEKPETPALSCGRMSKSTVVIIVIWIVAVLLTLAPMLLATSYTSDEGSIVYCPVYARFNLELDLFLQFATIVAVPLSAIVCYCIYCVKKQNKVGNIRSREQSNISRVILILSATYTLCLIPGFIQDFMFNFMSSSYEYNSFYHWGFITAKFLHFGFPIASVLALFCASVSYRQLLKQHLFCCKSGNQEAVVGEELGMESLAHPARYSVTSP